MYSCEMFRNGNCHVTSDNASASESSHYQSRTSIWNTSTPFNRNTDLGKNASIRQVLTERYKNQQTNGSGKTCELTLRLENEDMWKSFNAIGTEMIVTKGGRRVFPTLRVLCQGLLPEAMYTILVDVVPVDNHKYKYHDSEWIVAGSGEPNVSNCVYVHPDSPAPGSVWMRKPVSFHKLKLTNNKADLSGNIIVNTMQKYQIRIQVIQANGIESNHSCNIKTVTFPETTFIPVTAYQSEEITKLKINNNPFARSFRDPTNTTNRRNSKSKRKSSVDEEAKESDQPRDIYSLPGNKRRKITEEEASSMVTVATESDKDFSRRFMSDPPVISESLDTVANKRHLCSTFNNFQTVLSQEIWNPADCPIYERNHFDIPQPVVEDEPQKRRIKNLQDRSHARCGPQGNGSNPGSHVVALGLKKDQSLFVDSSNSIPHLNDFKQFVLPSYCQNTNTTYPHATGIRNSSREIRNLQNYLHQFQLPPHAESCVHKWDVIKTAQNTDRSELFSPKKQTCVDELALFSECVSAERTCAALIARAPSNSDIISSLSVNASIADRIDCLSQGFADSSSLGEVTLLSTNDVETVLSSVDHEYSTTFTTSFPKHIKEGDAATSVNALGQLSSSSEKEDILKDAIKLTLFTT